MGQYFKWVNFTKGELIDSSAFIWGDKWSCFHWVGSGLSNAALTLMADRWRGDVVALVGDETGIRFFESDGCTPRMRRVLEYTEGCDPEEYALDYFADVSALFSCTRGKTTYWRVGVGPDAEWAELPLVGPFDREIASHLYVINETTKEFYKRGEGDDDYDPFSDLMMVTSWDRIGPHCGIWIGDDVRPADEPPGEGHADITGVYQY